ncbi:MAG: flagellar hook-associated protein FlgK [Lachnospiraceae bacterium]|nr:flagellar hook-associated protein FlgK [Lachnospiraceae bacterium]MEE3460590.1 flagellar hook-associated protein FlgK [Lachnospiraceae bacterium]
MSLFTSFNAGVAGLRSSQSGLTTAAHNLANTDTEGYTRQQNIQADMTYTNIKVNSNGVLQAGLGTQVQEIRQIRDIFLDREYRSENGRKAFYEKLNATESQAEDIFGELEGTRFQNNLNDLWNTVQTFSTNPENVVMRQLFISKCNAFLESAKDVYKQMEVYQTSLNTEISQQVETINDYGKRIADLNVEIKKIEAPGIEHANDLRDERNQLMDELSAYVKYDYREDIDGSIQIYVNNSVFVDGGINYHMGVEKMKPMGSADKYAGQMYRVVWLDAASASTPSNDPSEPNEVFDMSTAFSHEKNTDIGSLYGILKARGMDVTDYSKIPVRPDPKDYENGENSDYYKRAVKDYNEKVKEYDNTTGNSIMTRLESEFDTLIHGITTMINDVFAPNRELDSAAIQASIGSAAMTDEDGNTVSAADIFQSRKKTGPDGKITDRKEVPYKILDVVNAPVGTDDNATIGTEVFTRRTESRYKVYTLDKQIYADKKDAFGNVIKDADGNVVREPLAQEVTNEDGSKSYRLYVYREENEKDPDSNIDTREGNETDVNHEYSIETLEMNQTLLDSYTFLPIKKNPVDGETGAYDYDIFPKLLKAWDEDKTVLDPDTITKYNYTDYYSALVGEIGINGELYRNMEKNQTTLVDGVQDKRSMISGVSSEEEMINMLKYQHAYGASSRYINVINQMLENLLNSLG